MSARHAYINDQGVVVQVISGAVDGAAHDALLADYRVLFGAVRCVRIEDDRPIWIEGSYDEETGFTPPPQPEVIEELITEPEA